MPALFLAFISILLWATLATLGQQLRHVPPFLLVGVALGVGCLPALRDIRSWFASWPTLLFGTGGIFLYHFLLFLSFRLAPPIEANLINYLWPILIVLFSAALLPGYRLGPHHVVGSLLALAGAFLVLTDGKLAFKVEFVGGYALAFGAALVWSSYSVLTKRLPSFPTAAVGGCCLTSALLSLVCHLALEPSVALSGEDLALLAVLGLGPMGAAFYTWDASLKKGDPRLIGALSYLTPLLSTLFLAFAGKGQSLSWSTGGALLLIVGGAVLSSLELLYPRACLLNCRRPRATHAGLAAETNAPDRK